MTGNTQRVKTAISLPDELFRRIDARARSLRLTRSALLAQAARDFLAKDAPAVDPTDAWNDAIARGGQPGDDPGAAAARSRSKGLVRRTERGRR